MEIADSGVTVHMVCPGPVQTPFVKRLFGATIGKVGVACTKNLVISVVDIGAGYDI